MNRNYSPAHKKLEFAAENRGQNRCKELPFRSQRPRFRPTTTRSRFTKAYVAVLAEGRTPCTPFSSSTWIRAKK